MNPDLRQRKLGYGLGVAMKKTCLRRHFRQLAFAALGFGWAFASPANPVGGTVTQGSASFSSQGSQFTIRTSDQTSINWQSFNIGLGETTTFLQPSSSSVVWNHINDPNPSQILGNLNANGYVILQNQSGFFIGGQAAISTHGLLMTTAPIPAPDLSSGGPWDLRAPPPTASIINYGQINTDRGGSVFLIANAVDNHGTVSAPGGTIGLYAGKDVLLSERPDGRGLSAHVTVPQGSIDNSGKLIADAGTIALQAQVVNQGGLIQANSVREVNGAIQLVASDAVNLGAGSILSAQGDSQGASPGGSIVIKSDASFTDQPGSVINVAGGAQGGNGGQVEISASHMNRIDSSINGRATPGFTSGKLFIDPANILLASYGDDAPNTGTVNPGDPPSAGSPDTLTLNVNSFNSLITANALSQIDLQATKNIEVSTLWHLPDSTIPGAGLTLTAGNNITVDDGAGIAAGKNWSLNLIAGTELASPAGRSPGNDGIYLNGSSFLQTQNGNISLSAANEILVNTGGSGAVGNDGIRTLGGGSIDVTTTYGDVNAGANPQGFKYNRTTAPYYTVSQNLGGISTAAGGDVTISAGGNVLSYFPNSSLTGPNATADAGTGAFGPEPGNVTISAGGSVFGHYVVANGTGIINASQDIGAVSASQNVALSLINGSWTLTANKGSIYLQEVRNPNGVFNSVGGVSSPGYHLFNYDPLASVTLNALEGGVYLTGLSLPRPNDPVPIVLPPILSINSGLGGVVLETTMSLFPAHDQGLQISTAGSLVGAPTDPTAPSPELIMSDSAEHRWVGQTTFSDTDHGPTPIGLNDPNPVRFDIKGNMQNVIFIADKQSTINVGGDMIDCGFSGENTHANDVTSITVGGEIRNRGLYSFVILQPGIRAVPAADLPPGLGSLWNTLLSLAVDPTRIGSVQVPADLTPSQLAAYAAQVAPLGVSFDAFTYSPSTARLGFLGQMPPDVLATLTHPLTVLRYGPDGFPIVDSSGHFVTDRVSWTDPAAIQNLFAESQGATSQTGLGYRLGGPGVFDIQAGSISLGNTFGILTCGVGDVQGGSFGYGSLASVTRSGATLNVTVSGNLDILTSSIASLGGGDVNVTSTGGSMDLGSQEVLLSGTRQVALGIFSSGRGNVNVTALGDINVDGSRIASYNGGNISVISLEGNINAGSGGTTFVQVPYNYVDPVTGLASAYTEEVFGSGIVAYTLVNGASIPGSAGLPGNITLKTPRGSIYASLGGILQEALDGNLSAGPTITLEAGTPASANSQGYLGNIDLGNSGVIGGSVSATANGNINGLVISRQSTTIDAAQSFSGTVLAGGTANLSAGGTVSGTIVGVGGINASGGQGVSATLLSQNVSVAGAQAQSTLGTSSSATAASQSAAQQAGSDSQKSTGLADDSNDDDKKKKKPAPVLTRKTGRVTVILPPGS